MAVIQVVSPSNKDSRHAVQFWTVDRFLTEYSLTGLHLTSTLTQTESGNEMTNAPPTSEERLRAGETSAAGELFAACRERLKKMVRLRLDRRLQGRLDASDMLQEAFLDVQ